MICRKLDRFVITGPTGAVGMALISKLLAEGKEVFAVTHRNSKRKDRLNIRGLERIECNIDEYNALSEKITHADAFIHLAWENTFGEGRNDLSSQLNNVKYALDAVECANKMHCQIFLGLGSQAEYGLHSSALKPDTPCFPINGYGVAKHCAGFMTRLKCIGLNLDHIWIRLLSAYGPYDGSNTMIMNTLRCILNNELPKFTSAEQLWDYIYSEDVANAIYLALLHGKNGATYPLGSGVARPLKDYINEMFALFNPTLKPVFGEIPYSENSVMHLLADISSLTEDTSFTPMFSFTEGIKKTYEYVKNNVS